MLPRDTRDLVKGVAMCRLPLSEDLVKFFRSVDVKKLNIDSKIYVLRAGIDYGLANTSLLHDIQDMDLDGMSKSSAVSLLYCSAMIYHRLEPDVCNRLVEKCGIDSNDMKSLIPLWACTVMGMDLRSWNTVIKELISKSRHSNNPRDRTMASLLAKEDLNRGQCLTQSTKHFRTISMLEVKYGKLIAEFEIAPGIIVDCASVENKTAIEIHGPSHFLTELQDGTRFLNGPTRAKEDIIKKLGWEIMHVDVCRGR
jgi:hypothetical protein